MSRVEAVGPARSEGAMTRAKQDQKLKREQGRELTKELEMTFPASDPPASTQPGGGITGPEVASPARRPERGKRRS